MYKGHPQTSHGIPSSHRTLTESLPPIQAKVVARLAAQGREPRAAGERGKAVRIVEMNVGVQDRIRAVLRDPRCAGLSDDPAKAAQARDTALARFTRRELAVQYAAGDKAHTLSELIHMLFDLESRAGRERAADFLSPIAG